MTMNRVIEALLEVVEKDPYPAGHTSLYWRLEGEKMIVGRRAGKLRLQGLMASMGPTSFLGRCLNSLERMSYLPVTWPLRFYRRSWRLTRLLARDLSQPLTQHNWRFAVVLALLTEHWERYRLRPRTFALIGDGEGFLGALLLRALPEARLYCIDLPKALVLQAATHQKANPAARLSLVSEGSMDGDAGVAFALPGEIERIGSSIDCAINICSMQEMEQSSVDAYFQFLRRRSGPGSRFYCVNRLEKKLPGGDRRNFHEYPWQRADRIFMEGPCPYITHTMSRATAPQGPRFFGRRIPFVNFVDGLTLHRLAHLAAPR